MACSRIRIINRIIPVLTALLVLLSWVVVADAAQPVRPAAVDARNIAHQVLDIEGLLITNNGAALHGLMADMERHRELLENLLDSAERELRVVMATGEQRPLALLLAVHRVLAEAGIRYGDYSASVGHRLGRGLLGQGLSDRRFDCAMYVYFYLGVAERLDLPLVAIAMPGHLSLRWRYSDGSHFNWEATIPNTCDDDFYRDWKRPAPAAVDRGIYLRDLSRDEVLASVYYRSALIFADQKRHQAARIAVESALALAPEMPDAHNLLGLILAAEGAPERALRHLDRAIELDPAFPHAYINRANIRLDRGDFPGAKADLAVLRQLERLPTAVKLD